MIIRYSLTRAQNIDTAVVQCVLRWGCQDFLIQSVFTMWFFYDNCLTPINGVFTTFAFRYKAS